MVQCYIKCYDGIGTGVQRILLLPSRGFVLIGGDDGKITSWDIENGTEVGKYEGQEYSVSSMALLNHGGKLWLYSSNYSTGTICKWDFDTREMVLKFESITSTVRGIAVCEISEGSVRLFAGCDDCTARVIDDETQTELSKFEGHSDWLRAVALSPDKQQLFTACDDRTVRTWNISDGSLDKTFNKHTGYVRCLFVVPNGRFFFSGSDDNSVRMWDIEAGTQVKVFEGHNYGVLSVAGSKDGRHIAVGSGDNKIKIWDTATGASITFVGHDGAVNDVVLSQDGTCLYSASGDQKVLAWDLQSIVEGKWITARLDDSDTIVFGSVDPRKRDGEEVLLSEFNKDGAERKEHTIPADKVCGHIPPMKVSDIVLASLTAEEMTNQESTGEKKKSTVQGEGDGDESKTDENKEDETKPTALTEQSCRLVALDKENLQCTVLLDSGRTVEGVSLVRVKRHFLPILVMKDFDRQNLAGARKGYLVSGEEGAKATVILLDTGGIEKVPYSAIFRPKVGSVVTAFIESIGIFSPGEVKALHADCTFDFAPVCEGESSGLGTIRTPTGLVAAVCSSAFNSGDLVYYRGEGRDRQGPPKRGLVKRKESRRNVCAVLVDGGRTVSDAAPTALSRRFAKVICVPDEIPDGPPKCPSGHILEPYLTTYDGFNCDGTCGRTFTTGTVLRSCRACNHDVCCACLYPMQFGYIASDYGTAADVLMAADGTVKARLPKATLIEVADFAKPGAWVVARPPSLGRYVVGEVESINLKERTFAVMRYGMLSTVDGGVPLENIKGLYGGGAIPRGTYVSHAGAEKRIDTVDVATRTASFIGEAATADRVPVGALRFIFDMAMLGGGGSGSGRRGQRVIVLGFDGKDYSILDEKEGEIRRVPPDDVAKDPYLPFKTFSVHGTYVYGLALSPDGKLIYTGSSGKMIRSWSITTGEELHSVEGHEGYVNGLCLTRDGLKLYSCGDDSKIKAWVVDGIGGIKARAGDGAEMTGHSSTVNCIKLSVDEKHIFSGANDMTCRMFNVETGAEVKKFESHTDWVRAVDVSPCRKYVFTASDDRRCLMWNIELGTVVDTFAQHEGYVRCIVIARGGDFFCSGSDDNTARIFDIEAVTERAVLAGHEGGVMNVRLSPDDRFLLTGDGSGSVRMFSVATKELMFAKKYHTGTVRKVMVSADSRHYFSASEDTFVRRCEIQSCLEDLWVSAAVGANGKYVLGEIEGGKDSTGLVGLKTFTSGSTAGTPQRIHPLTIGSIVNGYEAGDLVYIYPPPGGKKGKLESGVYESIGADLTCNVSIEVGNKATSSTVLLSRVRRRPVPIRILGRGGNMDLESARIGYLIGTYSGGDHKVVLEDTGAVESIPPMLVYKPDMGALVTAKIGSLGRYCPGRVLKVHGDSTVDFGVNRVDDYNFGPVRIPAGDIASSFDAKFKVGDYVNVDAKAGIVKAFDSRMHKYSIVLDGNSGHAMTDVDGARLERRFVKAYWVKESTDDKQALCPNGHMLKPFVAPAGVNCDGSCGRSFAQGKSMRSCRECNKDYCLECRPIGEESYALVYVMRQIKNTCEVMMAGTGAVEVDVLADDIVEVDEYIEGGKWAIAYIENASKYVVGKIVSIDVRARTLTMYRYGLETFCDTDLPLKDIVRVFNFFEVGDYTTFKGKSRVVSFDAVSGKVDLKVKGEVSTDVNTTDIDRMFYKGVLKGGHTENASVSPWVIVKGFDQDEYTVVREATGTIEKIPHDDVVKEPFSPFKSYDGHDGGVTAILPTRNGRHFISASSKLIRKMRVENGDEVLAFHGHSQDVQCLIFSSDGAKLFSSSSDETVRQWDATTGEELKTYTGHSGCVTELAISSDDKFLYSSAHDYTCRKWDVEAGDELLKFEGHGDWVRGLALSRDNSYLFSASDDRSVRKWDVNDGKELVKMARHTSYVRSVALSPNDEYCYSGSDDCTVRKWDASLGFQTILFLGHTSNVMVVIVSSDGSIIYSAGEDNEIRVWDATSGRCLKTLFGHTSGINCLALSPDSSSLFSGSNDQCVFMWSSSPASPSKWVTAYIQEKHQHVIGELSMKKGCVDQYSIEQYGRFNSKEERTVDVSQWMVGSAVGSIQVGDFVTVSLSDLDKDFFETIKGWFQNLFDRIRNQKRDSKSLVYEQQLNLMLCQITAINESQFSLVSVVDDRVRNKVDEDKAARLFVPVNVGDRPALLRGTERGSSLGGGGSHSSCRVVYSDTGVVSTIDRGLLSLPEMGSIVLAHVDFMDMYVPATVEAVYGEGVIKASFLQSRSADTFLVPSGRVIEMPHDQWQAGDLVHAKDVQAADGDLAGDVDVSKSLRDIEGIILHYEENSSKYAIESEESSLKSFVSDTSMSRRFSPVVIAPSSSEEDELELYREHTKASEKKTQCSNGHQLKPWVTPHGYCSCDRCRTKLPTNTNTMSCRGCDYDSCLKCFTSSAAERDFKYAYLVRRVEDECSVVVAATGAIESAVPRTSLIPWQTIVKEGMWVIARRERNDDEDDNAAAAAYIFGQVDFVHYHKEEVDVVLCDASKKRYSHIPLSAIKQTFHQLMRGDCITYLGRVGQVDCVHYERGEVHLKIDGSIESNVPISAVLMSTDTVDVVDSPGQAAAALEESGRRAYIKGYDGENYIVVYEDNGALSSVSPKLVERERYYPYRSLTGHTEDVWDILPSHDGKWLFSCSTDKTILMRKLDTGIVVRKFEGHSEMVISLALSPDGDFLYSASVDYTIRKWDVSSGGLVSVFVGHSDETSSLALSANGRYLFSSSKDKTCMMWDAIKGGKALGIFEGHEEWVRAIACSKSGDRLFSASYDRTIKMWDVNTKKTIKTYLGHGQVIRSLILSADEKFLFSGSDDRTIRMWDVESAAQRQVFRGHTDMVRGLAVNKDLSLLFSTSGDTSVRMWDVKDGSEIQVFEGHTAASLSVALSPDFASFYSGSSDKTVLEWNLKASLEAIWVAVDVGLGVYILGAASTRVRDDGKFLVKQYGYLSEDESREHVISPADIRTYVGPLKPGDFVYAKVATDKTGERQDTVPRTAQLGSAPIEEGNNTSTFSGSESANDAEYLRMEDIEEKVVRVHTRDPAEYSCTLRLSQDDTTDVKLSIAKLRRRFVPVHIKSDVNSNDLASCSWAFMIGRVGNDCSVMVEKTGKIETVPFRMIFVPNKGDYVVARDNGLRQYLPGEVVYVHSDGTFDMLPYGDGTKINIPTGNIVNVLDKKLQQGDLVTMSEDGGVTKDGSIMKECTGEEERYDVELPGQNNAKNVPVGRLSRRFQKVIIETDYDDDFDGKKDPFLCPNAGHKLKPFIVPKHLSCYCDECRETVEIGTKMMSCRPCDFDRCGKCQHKELVRCHLSYGFLIRKNNDTSDVIVCDTGTIEDGSVLGVKDFFRVGVWVIARLSALEKYTIAKIEGVHVKSKMVNLVRYGDEEMKDEGVPFGDVLRVFGQYEKGDYVVHEGKKSRVLSTDVEDGTLNLLVGSTLKTGISLDEVERRFDMAIVKQTKANDPEEGIENSDKVAAAATIATKAKDRRAYVRGFDGFHYFVVYEDDGTIDNKVPISNLTKDPHASFRQFEGHEGQINSLVVSADGLCVLTGSEDTTVRMWHIVTGEEVRIFRGHSKAVTAVVASPDGLYLFSGSVDNNIRMWSIRTAQEVRLLDKHKETVTSLALSPANNALFSSSKDQTVRMWNIEKGDEMKMAFDHEGEVNCVVVSIDEKNIFSAASDKTVRMINIDSWDVLRVFLGHKDSVRCLLVSQDGNVFYSGSSDKTIRMWDIATMNEMKCFQDHEKDVESLVEAVDGKHLYSSSSDGSMRMWNIDGGNIVQIFKADDTARTVHAVATSGDGGLLFGAYSDCVVRVWNVNKGEDFQVFRGRRGKVNCLVVSPDGQFVFSGSDDRVVRMWNTADRGNEEASFKGHDDIVLGLSLSSDGKRLYSCSKDKMVRSWNIEERSANGTYPRHTGSVNDVALLPKEAVQKKTGRRASGAGQKGPAGSADEEPAGDKVVEPDPAAPTRPEHSDKKKGDGDKDENAEEEAPKEVLSETKLLSASDDKNIILWDLQDKKYAKVFEGHEGPVNALAVFEDGLKFVSGSDDKTIRIWEVKGPKVRKLLGHTNYVLGVAINKNKIFSCSSDKTIRIWDALTENEEQLYQGHTDEVTFVTVSSDGKRLFSGSRDKTILVWNTQGRADKLQTLKGHEGGVLAGGMADSKSYFYSGSDDQTIRKWTVDSGAFGTFRGKEEEILSIAVSSDGLNLYSGSGDATVRMWGIESAEETLVFKGHSDKVISVVVSKSKDKLVSGSEDRTILVWDTKTGKQKHQLSCSYAMSQIALSLDEKRVLAGTSNGIMVIDIESGSTVKTLSGHTQGVTSVAVYAEADTDRELLVSGSEDCTCRVWDVDASNCLVTFDKHQGKIFSVAVSSNRRHAFSGSGDCTIRSWELTTGTQLMEFRNNTTAPITRVAVGSLHNFVLSVSTDRVVRMWNVDNGMEVHAFKGHEEDITTLALAPNGRSFFSGSKDGTMRKYPILPGSFRWWNALVADQNYKVEDLYQWIENYPRIMLYPSFSLRDMRSGNIFFYLFLTKDIARLDVLIRHIRGNEGLIEIFVQSLLSRTITSQVSKMDRGDRLSALQCLAKYWAKFDLFQKLFFDVIFEFSFAKEDKSRKEPDYKVCDLGDIISAIKAFPAISEKMFDRLKLVRALDITRGENSAAVQSIGSFGFVVRGYSAVIAPDIWGEHNASDVEKLKKKHLDAKMLRKAIRKQNRVDRAAGKEAEVPAGSRPATLERTASKGSGTPKAEPDSAGSGQAGTTGEGHHSHHSNHVVRLYKGWRNLIDFFSKSEAIRFNPYVVPVPDILGEYDNTTLMKVLVKAVRENPSTVPAFNTDIPTVLVEYKWQQYAKYLFIWNMFWALLSVGVFAFTSGWSKILVTSDLLYENVIGYILQISMMALSVHHLHHEFNQMLEAKGNLMSYFGDIWNYLTLTGYGLTVVALILGWSYDQKLGIVEIFLALAAVPIWSQVLFYLRGFSSTGPLVRMIVATTADISSFILVLLILILGFTNAFYVIFLVYRDAGLDEYGTIWRALRTTYGGMLGNFDFDPFDAMQNRAAKPIFNILQVFYLFASIILLLNLLIAILSDSYARVQEHAAAEFVYARAQLILELEDQFHKLLNFFEPEVFAPSWLHVALPEGNTGINTLAEDEEKEDPVTSLRRDIEVIGGAISERQKEEAASSASVMDRIDSSRAEMEKKFGDQIDQMKREVEEFRQATATQMDSVKNDVIEAMRALLTPQAAPTEGDINADGL